MDLTTDDFLKMPLPLVLSLTQMKITITDKLRLLT